MLPLPSALPKALYYLTNSEKVRFSCKNRTHLFSINTVGTASSDGVGLFAASVSALCQLNTRLLAATHFYEVFSFSGFFELHGMSFFTLETMMVPGECPEFLYQLVPGRYVFVILTDMHTPL